MLGICKTDDLPEGESVMPDGGAQIGSSGLASPNVVMHLAVDRTGKWTPGDTIKIKFINGTQHQHAKVMQYAPIWLRYANLHMQFVARYDYADVRVAFNDDGHWSRVGTACRRVPSQDQPTMNLDLGHVTSEAGCERVILHEFGHALGCIHEHQSPAGGIQWNTNVIYDYYWRTSRWDRRQVDQQVIEKAKVSRTQFSAFDRHSIMLYPIPPGHAWNITVGWNTTLSAMDKSYIAQMYPGRSGGPVVDGCGGRGGAVETRDSEGRTPLHIACRDGNENMVSCLLQQRVQIEAKEYQFGYTPLHMATWYRRDQVVLLLLLAGANTSARTNSGHTPLDLARLWKYDDIIHLLTS